MISFLRPKLPALTLPLFARGVFVAEFQLNNIIEPLAGLISSTEILLPLDNFVRGGSVRVCHDQIADAYRRAQLQVNTTEIGAAMDHALNLHHAGHWQAFFNFHLKRPMAAARVTRGAFSLSSELTDSNASAAAVSEAEDQRSTEAATGAASYSKVNALCSALLLPFSTLRLDTVVNQDQATAGTPQMLLDDQLSASYTSSTHVASLCSWRFCCRIPTQRYS